MLTLVPQASVYGKCIVADYNSVHKDKCVKEFMQLKNCYLVRNQFIKSHQNDMLILVEQKAAKKP